MQISDIGKAELLRRIWKATDDKPQSTSRTVVLTEGVHFDLTYTDLMTLGNRALNIAACALAGQGSKATHFGVMLAVPKRFEVEDIEAVYSGVRETAETLHATVATPDITASVNGLAIAVTAIGDNVLPAADGQPQPNDLICITGDIGAAYMGTQLLEREKAVYYQQLKHDKNADFQPDFAGREYIIQRALLPMPHTGTLQALHDAGIVPTAKCDVSDSLAYCIRHICHKAGTGCRVFEDKLPIDYQTAAAAEEFNLNITTVAIGGGADHELLITAPLSDLDKLQQIPDLHIIGHLTKPELGTMLATRDGQEFHLKAQGFVK